MSQVSLAIWGNQARQGAEASNLPNAGLVLYEGAGHGDIFQYQEAFMKKTLEFLAR